ncbi:MAG: hypothetical protein ACOYOU_00190 [Kiritimatiellia bacterium]
MNASTLTPPDASPRPWSGRLAYYHPTQSGGGAAARMEFHPARPDRDGCFFLEMARQKTLPTRNENGRQSATFDWENKITVKLGLPDVCSLLLVLEGKCEQAGNGRNGLFHDTAEANTVINLRRQAEPAVGFALEISRKPKRADGEVQRTRVVLTEGEAIGVRCIFQHAIHPMVFGMGVGYTRIQESGVRGQNENTSD